MNRFPCINDDGTGCGTDDAIGFTFVRSGNGISSVTASQDTLDYAIGGEVILVYGIAQGQTTTTAGNLGNDTANGSTGADGGTTQAVYGNPLLLIKGTFTSGTPSFINTAGDLGSVFIGSSGDAAEAATIVFSCGYVT